MNTKLELETKKDEIFNLLDKYLEPIYANTNPKDWDEIRYMQREIYKALEHYQEDIIDNIPF